MFGLEQFLTTLQQMHFQKRHFRRCRECYTLTYYTQRGAPPCDNEPWIYTRFDAFNSVRFVSGVFMHALLFHMPLSSEVSCPNALQQTQRQNGNLPRGFMVAKSHFTDLLCAFLRRRGPESLNPWVKPRRARPCQEWHESGLELVHKIEQGERSTVVVECFGEWLG